MSTSAARLGGGRLDRLIVLHWDVVAASVVAGAVYVRSLLNRWALDDHGIVVDNPAAHSIRAALAAFFDPYWPASLNVFGGLYRPLTVLTYGIDWSLTGGTPWWSHAVNVVLHMVAVALVVLVARRWLNQTATTVVGLVFALHPVHVEAVANVVGRAELLVAVFLLGSVLAARRYRTSEKGFAAALWLLATLLLVVLGLLSKEHGIVAIGVIAVDHLLERGVERKRDSVALYAGIALVSVGWLFLWSAVAGGFVGSSEAANLRGLDAFQRLATMLPAQFDVLRLLVLPIDLSPDYNPEMIPRRLEFGALALGGLVIGVAVLVLGMVSVRRAPAVAFGILVAAVTYSPTSNLLFSSGTALAERALYLAVLAPAMTIGWLVVVVPAMHRRVLWIGVAALASVYTVRTVTRIPFWRDMRTVILEDVLLHPHNYRSYVRVASTFELIGDSAKALQYYRMAAAVFPDDPYVARRLVPLARALDRPYLALREAERSLAMDPGHSHLNRLTVETLWDLELRDSAVTVARSFVERRLSTASVKLYLELLERRGGGGGGGDPDWRVALVRSRLAWIEGRPHAASGEIDAIREGELLVGAGTERDFCWDLEQARGLLLTLAPDLLDVALEEVASGSLRCALI